MNGRFWQIVRRVLITAACAGSLLTPGLAQEVKGLQAEAPQVDSQGDPASQAGTPATDPKNSPDPKAPSDGQDSPFKPDGEISSGPQTAHRDERTLYGGVNKSGYARGLSQSGQADAVSSAYAAVVEKLGRGEKLSADDYRSLHIGVYGYELYRLYFQNEARVTKVFSGCPAAQVGIQVGDLQLVDDATNDAKIVDTSRPSWWFNCGTEGQATDVTIKRDGQLLHFHLVRMNIEDIPDPRLRRTYEQMVQLTGGNGGIIQSGAPVSAGAVLRALLGF